MLASTGYRHSKNGRRQYHRPAYLLTTDLTTPAAIRIQDYCDRWGSAVNHRDEQAIRGVGDAPVWHEQSGCKGPALIAAMFIWLLLAGLPGDGPTRTADHLSLPQWRSRPKRPSCQDLINLLRQQLTKQPTRFATATAPPTVENLVITAAAGPAAPAPAPWPGEKCPNSRDAQRASVTFPRIVQSAEAVARRGGNDRHCTFPDQPQMHWQFSPPAGKPSASSTNHKPTDKL